MNTKILVATHKKYWMPEEKIYFPVQVGRKLHPDLGYTGDDEGENISEKNPHFNELTAMYWAWKNLDAEVVGLVHYRRYFVKRKKGRTLEKKRASLLSKNEILELLQEADMILPQPRNYYIESSYSHYAHAHNVNDLDETKRIIQEKFPTYIPAFEVAMSSSKAHMFNMFIMKRADFDAYSDWLFEILFELEKRIDISAYSSYEARVYGFISERLLDVWVMTNQKTYKELPVLFMEPQNWVKKGSSFLKRKFFRSTKK
ncbi:exopolysaccharide biosynthesis protein [Enterococcus sp. JM4C]|uniref:DUF4422 domain-containing protein n=1 Tax=Candidatus Enterococcus huntleyi TaxID=1857217 RepID=UPI00137B34E8|nr:DUF4422 domain-containing protein [Enterococcus sp. JM4C]KAF1297254.1 exopolysaccharide biosynthesis protein [Enterococcus sp. JM4C]